MNKTGKILQVGFTYIGTVVGAGFATGQEILQFFTQYGWMSTLAIAIACLLFVWIGTKLMLMAADIGARSYEDLNNHLFGETAGLWISLFTFVILFSITAVMLAGAGSVFVENLRLPYQAGLFFTLALTYIIIIKGIDGILAVNTVVVPMMLLFNLVLVAVTLDLPTAGNFIHLMSDAHPGRILLSPFLYTAFNLGLAQAVLVPVGSTIKDPDILRKGGMAGGIGIGLLLLGGHFALAAHMPGITQYDIPMSSIVYRLGRVAQFLFVLVIFAEIFTTFIANIYGLTLQIRDKVKLTDRTIILTLLALCYLISQIGFKTLLSTLYPLFGWICMVWLVMIMWRKRTR
ncbi:YkvI family membrane protein [Ferviditalea candida]|uniref:Membrane protein YkvI n=1 Tax=Ferviditalea candida TaxID=3108399 RepID=A0ABU5ZFW2_9BACL|nr:hypothetical protein [Paenibacillaceae bacterium T2]